MFVRDVDHVGCTGGSEVSQFGRIGSGLGILSG